MFTFGVFISVEHLQNFRLLIIWFCLSTATVIAAIYISKQCRRAQLNIVFVMMLPFLIPVLVACTTELVASWDPSIVLNEEHNNTGRWKYLHSSPNGFGFDAGILAVISVACLTFMTQGDVSRSLYFYFESNRPLFLRGKSRYPTCAYWYLYNLIRFCEQTNEYLVGVFSFYHNDIMFRSDWR